MSSSANFPSTLYATTSVTLDAVLIQDEWTQVAVEIEAMQPYLKAVTGSALLVQATGHGALGTAATHPFSALTGTFTAAQHGAITTAGNHPFSSLTGTFTAAQHGVLATAGAHPVSGLSNLFTTNLAVAAFTVPTAETDVVGGSLTLDTPGTYLILGKYDVVMDASALAASVICDVRMTDTNNTLISIAGPTVTQFSLATGATRTSVSDVALFTTTISSQIAKMRCSKNGTAGTVTLQLFSGLTGVRVK